MQPNSPDTYGMVQTDPGQLEERLEKIETPKPKNDQNDTLWVKNIDTDCHDQTYEPVRVSERWRDPESGRIVTNFKDVIYQFDHSEKFQVRWSAQIFSIKPGETARMPRFLGEHFATQLADHILGKMGDAQGKMLRNDPLKRPEILKQIIIKEEPYFFSGPESVGSETMKQFEQLNQAPQITGVEGEQYNNQSGLKEQNLTEGDGMTSDSIITPVGVLNKQSVEATEDVVKRLGQETPEDNLNVPQEWQTYTKKDLIEQIRHMAPDYKFGQNYNKAQLVGILQRF